MKKKVVKQKKVPQAALKDAVAPTAGAEPTGWREGDAPPEHKGSGQKALRELRDEDLDRFWSNIANGSPESPRKGSEPSWQRQICGSTISKERNCVAPAYVTATCRSRSCRMPFSSSQIFVVPISWNHSCRKPS